jgi:four helix bundle protein
MEKPYDLLERSFLFAKDVVFFCRKVAGRDWVLRVLSIQLTKAATSVGANLEEAAAGQSKADFISKQAIALKEAREARYWLRLLLATEPSLSTHAAPLTQEASQFIAILTRSLKTARSNPARRD